MQNGFIESFNGKLRDECLNANWFSDLEHAQHLLDAWVADYNEVRPRSALDNGTPPPHPCLSRSWLEYQWPKFIIHVYEETYHWLSSLFAGSANELQ